jgi:hypothetical protein
MKRKQEPDPAIFYALHDANVASETALRRSGYSAKTPRAVASMKHKLLARRSGERAASHPAASTLDPVRRAIWDALTPSCQEWLTTPDCLSLTEELSTPWLLKDAEFIGNRRPAACPMKPWDTLSRRQEAAYHDPKAR